MKLVRDGTEAALRNPRVAFGRAPEPKRTHLVFSKLLEEAGEWLAASSTPQRVQELGDLQEVIWALGEIDGISKVEIAIQAADKREARGSFDNLATISVETDDDRSPGREAAAFSNNYMDTADDSRWYSG